MLDENRINHGIINCQSLSQCKLCHPKDLAKAREYHPEMLGIALLYYFGNILIK